MKRISIVSLALLATFAMSAVGASSALAELLKPEFLLESGGFPITFTSSGSNSLLLAKGSGLLIHCSTVSATGTVPSSTKVSGVLVTYEGCGANNTAGSKTSCGEAKTKGGSVKKQIMTNTLSGELGEGNGGVAAELLVPEAGGTFVEVEIEKGCGTSLLKTSTVTGGVVGEVEAGGGFETQGKLNFKTVSEEQALNEFNMVASRVLTSFKVASAIESAETVTFSQPVKLDK